MKNITEDIEAEFSTCLLANISICAVSQEDRFIVIVQNPLSRNITHYVRLPINGTSYNITSLDGQEVYDIFDSIHLFDYVEEDVKPSSKELVFAARNLPPLGIKVYYIEKTDESINSYKPFQNLTLNDTYFGTEVCIISVIQKCESLK